MHLGVEKEKTGNHLCEHCFDPPADHGVRENKEPLGLVDLHDGCESMHQVQGKATIDARGRLKDLQGEVAGFGPGFEACVWVRAHLGCNKRLAVEIRLDIFPGRTPGRM